VGLVDNEALCCFLFTPRRSSITSFVKLTFPVLRGVCLKPLFQSGYFWHDGCRTSVAYMPSFPKSADLTGRFAGCQFHVASFTVCKKLYSIRGSLYLVNDLCLVRKDFQSGPASG